MQGCREFTEFVIISRELSISSPQHSVGPDSPQGRKILKGKRPRGSKTTTGGGKQKCPPGSPESPTSSVASPPISFPCSPISQFCPVGIVQNVPSAHNESSQLSFTNIPVTVMESDGFNLQNLQLLVDNNAETMDERGDSPLDEDIASLFTPEMISSLLAQNASALDDASSVE